MTMAKSIHEGVPSRIDAHLETRSEAPDLLPEEQGATPVDVLSFAGMLADLTPEEEAAFDRAIRSSLQFDRKIPD